MSDPGPRRRFYSSVPAQTLIALSFNIISLFAGGLISILTPQFGAAPWILALFPPILTIRGGIGGIFSGNLATMLHLGLIRPRIRRNTPVYAQLISAVFAITLVDTLAMGVFAFLLNLVLGRAYLGQVLIFAVVPPVACVLAMSVSIPLTSLLAIAAFRRGLDPDILVYPILASINDMVVTAAFVVTVYLVLSGGPSLLLLYGLFLSIIMATGLLVWRNRGVDFFRRTIREGTTVVIMSSLFGGVNGVFLSGMSRSLQSYPGVVVLYPALTNALGNLGSIVGSTTTTKFALGIVRSLTEEVRDALGTIARIEAVALLMHLSFGVITFIMVRATTPSASLSSLILVAVVVNLLTFHLIGLFTLVLAFQAFKRGLNPDNVVIPVITSISDTAATLALLASLAILKFFGAF
ncbi:MAG: magnesium transporter [Candidatus Bathyarchaeota archaeon]|nr:magnesium transporter [Candidatus Bathyarchaeota archaeon]